MAKPTEKPRRRRTRIAPIAILVGAVAASAGVVPACQDDGGSGSSDMGTSDLPRYPHDVSAHGFFDLSHSDLSEPGDGGHGD